jgi:hypothetical protein
MSLDSPRRSFVFALMIVAAAACGVRAQDVLKSSSWSAKRHAGGSYQNGAFRIKNGLIYQANQPQPVGRAGLDALGRLSLSFQGHRKFNGTAVVGKAGKGVWKGQIVLTNGTRWPFVMRRK